jgi:hypothetical protein
MSDPEITRPVKPEPSPDATVRMVAGMPEDPRQTQPLKRSDYLPMDGTLKLPLAELTPSPDQTQEMPLPKLDLPSLPAHKVDQPTMSATQTQKLALQPEPRKRMGWKLPLALVGGLVVLGAAAYLWFGKRPASLPPPFVVDAASPESVPEAARVYLEQAKAGDARAMRMLGAMYYNGLDVPKDRAKGIYWYRMAAEKGSDAARIELSQLEGGR